MDRIDNDDNLQAFHQEHDDVPVPRKKRRSSILKILDGNLPEERRVSRRISFHNNIMCQQILPDGTTQIITEALRNKRKDDSKTDESSMEETNPERTGKLSNDTTNKNDEEEESIVEVSMNCDADDEAETREVMSSTLREDKTKLFGGEETEGLMDITMMDFSTVTSSSDESQTNVVFSDKTNIFDASKTEAVMNIDSRQDTENEESCVPFSQEDKVLSQPMELTRCLTGLVPPQLSVQLEEEEKESEEIQDEAVEARVQEQRQAPEVTEVVPQDMDLTEVLGGITGRVSMEDVQENLYKAFSRVSWPKRGQLDNALKMRKEQLNKTLSTLKEDMSMSSVDSYSETPTASPAPSLPPSSSGRKRFSLSMRSRMSLGESPMFSKSMTGTPLDKNRSHVFSYRESPLAKVSSPLKKIKESVTAESPAKQRIQEKEETEEVKKGEDMDLTTMDMTLTEKEQSVSRISSSSTDFLASSGPSSREGSQSVVSQKKSEMETSFLSSVGNETSDDSDSSSVGDSFQQFDKSYGVHLNDDEDNDGLHDDSVFLAMRDAETSFALSPDSSFYTSFVRRDDTLMIMAEDLEAKLNECSVLRESVVSAETPEEPEEPTFIPLRRFDKNAFGAKVIVIDPDHLQLLFLYGILEVKIELGTTLRSFNGIPIKIIKKIQVESRLKSDEELESVLDSDLCWDFFVHFQEDHKVFFRAAQDAFMTSFDEVKNHLMTKFTTTDKLPDLLNEIGCIVNRSRDFLKDVILAHVYYPARLYTKTTDNVYEFAFELPGPNRNFFLLLPLDPKVYPFSSIRCRFGFAHGDKHLYNVNTFSNALSFAVKPGKGYITRMIQGAKEYVVISRRLRQKQRSNKA